MIKAFLTAFLAVFFVQNVRADDALSCLTETARYEKREKIQTNLLSAVALVESGRYSPEHKTGVAWPWTVTAQGKGRFFDSKEEAIAAVKALQAQGVTNIDVGCMQVNLQYHPDVFKDLNEAFTPSKNVAYAAKYLKKLYDETGSWGGAATRYHSAKARYAFRYEDKLLDVWKKLVDFGNPAVPSQTSTIKETGAAKKEFFPLPSSRKKETTDKEKKILPGSEESKKIADEWRREQLEKYFRLKRGGQTP